MLCQVARHGEFTPVERGIPESLHAIRRGQLQGDEVAVGTGHDHARVLDDGHRLTPQAAGAPSYRYHTVMRLSPVSMSQLPAAVGRPGYARDEQRCGIVHFGIGAFHRAHQALYTDEALAAGDRDWAITGVSLRSAQVREQLAPQAGLYTVTESDRSGDAIRVVGAVREVLVAAQEPARVIAAVAAPATPRGQPQHHRKGLLARRQPDARFRRRRHLPRPRSAAGTAYALRLSGGRARAAAAVGTPRNHTVEL